jgi:hypothetical protein
MSEVTSGACICLGFSVAPRIKCTEESPKCSDIYIHKRNAKTNAGAIGRRS